MAASLLLFEDVFDYQQHQQQLFKQLPTANQNGKRVFPIVTANDQKEGRTKKSRKEVKEEAKPAAQEDDAMAREIKDSVLPVLAALSLDEPQWSLVPPPTYDYSISCDYNPLLLPLSPPSSPELSSELFSTEEAFDKLSLDLNEYEDKKPSLDQLLIQEKHKAKCSDKRFSSGLNLVERIPELKVSLIVNLFANSFSINSQLTARPYDSSTSDLIKAIDSRRLTPDVVDLLSDLPCYYYDGCIVIEVRDYRFSTHQPQYRRILLSPDNESLSFDIDQLAAENESLTQDDLLQIEQKMLLAKKPSLCLDPDIKAGLLSNLVHYNANKFNLSRPLSKVHVNRRSDAQTDAIQVTASASSLPLLRFLLYKNPHYFHSSSTNSNNNNESSELAHSQPVSDSGINKLVYAISHASKNVPTFSRATRLQKNSGNPKAPRVIWSIEVAGRPSGCDAALRCGYPPETVNSGDFTKFSMGSVETTERMLKQMISLFEKDNYQIQYDSQLGIGLPPAVAAARAASPSPPTAHNQPNNAGQVGLPGGTPNPAASVNEGLTNPALMMKQNMNRKPGAIVQTSEMIAMMNRTANAPNMNGNPANGNIPSRVPGSNVVAMSRPNGAYPGTAPARPGAVPNPAAMYEQQYAPLQTSLPTRPPM